MAWEQWFTAFNTSALLVMFWLGYKDIWRWTSGVHQIIELYKERDALQEKRLSEAALMLAKSDDEKRRYENMAWKFADLARTSTEAVAVVATTKSAEPLGPKGSVT